MINKRIKVGIQKIKKPTKKIKLSLGTIALMIACLMLLIIATFTQIKLNFSIPYSNTLTNLNFEYIPQIPVVIFIASLLGIKWGVLTVILYVILGLNSSYPIFGLGGGLSYIFQYTFGYIIAFILGAIFCAKELRFEKSIFRVFTASFLSVFIIHFTGMIYMIIIALLRHDSWSFIYDLIFYQSLSKIVYDIVFSLIAIIIAKGCRKLLWIIV